MTTNIIIQGSTILVPLQSPSKPACSHVTQIPMIRQPALIRLYGAQVTFTFSMNHNIDRSLSIGAVHWTSD